MISTRVKKNISKGNFDKMKINNKIDKIFGPSGVFAGYVLIVIGGISSFYYPGALILLIIGVYTAFTSTGTTIDTDKKKVKHYISHFGLFRSGKWLPLESFSAIKIAKSNLSYTTFSRSNRRTGIKKTGYRISLVTDNKKSGIPIMHSNQLPEAKRKAEELSQLLGLAVEITKRGSRVQQPR